MGVCGSVVLFYGRSVLRRPYGRLWLRRLLLCMFVSPSPPDAGLIRVWRAFRGNVLIYRRLLLCRPRSWGFVPPLTVGDFPFCLSLLLFFMCSALAKSLLGEHTSPNEEFTSDSLQLVLLGRGWFSSEELF